MVDKPVCRKCRVPLIIGDTWSTWLESHHDYICMNCNRKYHNEYRKKNREHINDLTRRFKYKHGQLPMNENRECPMFLGVYIAERVLGHVFKNVKRMPIENVGFDFICGRKKKIDVKSSCIQYPNRWRFNIKHNKIADFFLCLAFDNRCDLTPMHLWLVPSNEVNMHAIVSITLATAQKWDRYSLDIDKVLTCCNVLRGE